MWMKQYLTNCSLTSNFSNLPSLNLSDLLTFYAKQKQNVSWVGKTVLSFCMPLVPIQLHNSSTHLVELKYVGVLETFFWVHSACIGARESISGNLVMASLTPYCKDVSSSKISLYVM